MGFEQGAWRGAGWSRPARLAVTVCVRDVESLEGCQAINEKAMNVIKRVTSGEVRKKT